MVDKYIDKGLNPKVIEEVAGGNHAPGETLKDYADRHRAIVKAQHKLGFKSHLKPPCSSCGHRICRCKDRRERERRNIEDINIYGSE